MDRIILTVNTNRYGGIKIEQKRLLIITNTYPSGTDYKGIFIQEQILQLNHAFKEIIIISPIGYYPKFLLRYRWFRDYIGYNVFPADYSRDNISVYFPRYFSIPYFIDKYLHLRKYLFTSSVKKAIRKRSMKFDLIHAHFISPAGFAGVKVKKCCNVPLVITGHGGDVYTEISEKNRNRDKKVIESLITADKIITTSKINYEILKNLPGMTVEKLTILKNGYDELKFFPMDKNALRKELDLPDNKFIVLSIGNLVEIKGHTYLIDAIGELKKENLEIECIIIGRGNPDPLNSQIFSLSLEQHVRIINGIPHDQVPKWLNACDLFVLPSLNEGSPTVIPEAWGCGIPVIASSVGGIPELFQDANVGFLVPPGNSKEICRAMKRAINHSWDYERIVQHSRQFTWNRIAEQLLIMYQELLR